MRRLLLVLACALPCLLQTPAYAQARTGPELEAMLAPIALYPDAALSNILRAATHPTEVSDAARLPGADNPAWDPSVRALVSFPEVLQGMAESPQWMHDLGDAALAQGPQVTQAIQALREHAYAGGYLRSNEQQLVQHYGSSIVVQPAVPQVVYLPYYNPLLVYGAWQPLHRVVSWRPWPARRVFVTKRYVPDHESHRQPIAQSARPIAQRGNGPPSPALQMQRANQPGWVTRRN
jgi:hypothetical protein